MSRCPLPPLALRARGSQLGRRGRRGTPPHLVPCDRAAPNSGWRVPSTLFRVRTAPFPLRPPAPDPLRDVAGVRRSLLRPRHPRRRTEEVAPKRRRRRPAASPSPFLGGGERAGVRGNVRRRWQLTVFYLPRGKRLAARAPGTAWFRLRQLPGGERRGAHPPSSPRR